MTAVNYIETITEVNVPETLGKVYLYPGQIFTASQPMMVTTILGSCVAVCLWDERSQIAGINHFLLPNNPIPGQSDARYGNTAIARLIDEMVSAGATKQRLVAKLVGGASILMGAAGPRFSIGDQNIAAAH